MVPQDSAPFTVTPVQGKGLGVLATQPIAPGTQILSEPPLFTTASLSNPTTIEKDLGAIVRSLPKDSQRAFLSLHNNSPGPDPFSNIIRSNGYPLGPSSPIGGIFPLVARLNHSCLPNAQHAFDPTTNLMRIHALRPIAPNEEITLAYTTGGPSTTRKANLKTYFNFACTCEICALPGPQQTTSDANYTHMTALDDGIGDAKRVQLSPEKALRDCRELLALYRAERVCDLRLPRLWYDAFQICAMHSDAARARVFAGLSARARVLCEGAGSAEAANCRELARRPEGFENWGVTKRWVSRVGEGEGREGDEAWLFRDA
ncbi:hypothetical protein MBLNU230_g1889t1 [Neophaeotheca triangularis]